MFKYLFLFIFFIFICCCGTINLNPNYSVSGVSVFIQNKGPIQEQLIDATDFYIKKLSLKSNISIQKLNKIFQKLYEIHFVDNYLSTYEIDNAVYYIVGLYQVYTTRSPDIYITYPGCIAMSSWFHELMHHFLMYKISKGDLDKSHKSEWWHWIDIIKHEYWNIPKNFEYCKQQDAKFNFLKEIANDRYKLFSY